MPTAQEKLGDLIVAQISPASNIAAVNKFAPGVVEFVSISTRTLNGVVDSAPTTTVAGGIMPFFTHVTGSPWKEYLVLPSTIAAGDTVSVTIDGATHAVTLPAAFSATGTAIQYDGDRIDGTITGAELIPGAGDELGGPIVAVSTNRLAPGQRGLVVYEHQPPNAGGGKMFVISPGQASGIPLAAFRTVNATPATGALVGEAILNSVTGAASVWNGLNWQSIVPPSIVSMPTDADVLNDVTSAPGTYAFSQATGNLFARYTDGTGADVWRQVGVMKFATEGGLLAATAADGSMAYAVDTNNYFQRNGTNWEPFGVMQETEANLLASSYSDAAMAYATDTDRFWIHVAGAWQPFGTHLDTEANVLASSPRDGTTAYATDSGIRYLRIGGAWMPDSYYRDVEATILAATPTAGLIAVSTDTGKVYFGDGTKWIGQPFREYATEAALLVDTPIDGVMAVAVDTGMVFYRASGAWVSINRYATPIGAADPAAAASTQGDLFYNTGDQVAKVYDGVAWQALGTPSQWAIGSVQQSVLDATQFNAALPTTERNKWKLADGQNIVGTALSTLKGWTTVPDMRGAYFRMAGANTNHPGWDGGGLGLYSEDRTARPTTPFTTDQQGNHYHSLGWYDQEPQDIVQQYHNHTAANPSPQVAHMFKIEDPGQGGGGAEGQALEKEMAVSTDGQHSHTINGGGDAETRPKTYALNVFIKVN